MPPAGTATGGSVAQENTRNRVQVPILLVEHHSGFTLLSVLLEQSRWTSLSAARREVLAQLSTARFPTSQGALDDRLEILPFYTDITSLMSSSATKSAICVIIQLSFFYQELYATIRSDSDSRSIFMLIQYNCLHVAFACPTGCQARPNFGAIRTVYQRKAF
ncbi:hypothetical protein K491DRAFT_418291 [Lophiostoma macrostomum CBS 122681]|uniref:Uncharacterized protein n=1 Tax=Lophiostoma macrostomum CBS 122681 TaxID=1314788 RepID=A0A6A6TSF9_9PLEO|nr:hypothetical protein K491DRAFT_418291 [Lophiostoma macrostomum CBS 122681]